MFLTNKSLIEAVLISMNCTPQFFAITADKLGSACHDSIWRQDSFHPICKFIYGFFFWMNIGICQQVNRC